MMPLSVTVVVMGSGMACVVGYVHGWLVLVLVGWGGLLGGRMGCHARKCNLQFGLLPAQCSPAE